MLRVLLVDDEPFISQGLSVLIDWEKEGYEIVKVAINGKEALDYLKENTVELIIADIQMPVMTGLELLEHIREEKVSEAHFVLHNQDLPHRTFLPEGISNSVPNMPSPFCAGSFHQSANAPNHAQLYG